MIHLIIKDGKPILKDEASVTLYNRVMDAYSNTGKMLVMTIEEYFKNTTESQQKMFTALLVKCSDISGYSYEELEYELIQNFAPYKYIRSIMGEMTKERKNISEMNHKEFNIFIEQSIQFCTEFYDVKF